MAWALKGEDEASRRSRSCLRYAMETTTCPARAKAMKMGGGDHRLQASRLLAVNTVLTKNPIFSPFVLLLLQNNSLIGLKQSCSLIIDLQL